MLAIDIVPALVDARGLKAPLPGRDEIKIPCICQMLTYYPDSRWNNLLQIKLPSPSATKDQRGYNLGYLFIKNWRRFNLCPPHPRPRPRIDNPRNQCHLRIWVTILCTLHIAHCTLHTVTCWSTVKAMRTLVSWSAFERAPPVPREKYSVSDKKGRKTNLCLQLGEIVVLLVLVQEGHLAGDNLLQVLAGQLFRHQRKHLLDIVFH
jgi:hypothetical protein